MFRKLSGLGLIILALIFLGNTNTSCLAVLFLGIGGFLLLGGTSEKKETSTDQRQQASSSPTRRPTNAYEDVTITVTYTSRASSFVEAAQKYASRSGKPCPHVHFKSYWPTYSDMNKAQQDWYFYWRNQVRNNCFPDTSLSYIFLHVYELINNVGVRNVDDGYQQLRRLWLSYRDRFPNLDHYLADWTTDYLVVNRSALDPLHVYADTELQPALAQCAPDLTLNAFLKQGKQVGEMPSFLLDALVDYKIHKSKFYQSGYADVVQTALRQALDAVDAYLQKKEGKGVFQKFQPQERTQIKRNVFQSAIYDGDQSAITIASVYPYAQHSPLRMFLTGVVKHTENLLRQHYGFAGRLKVTDFPHEAAGAIEGALTLSDYNGTQLAEFDLSDTGSPRTTGVVIPARAIGNDLSATSRSSATIPSSGNLKIVSNQYLREAQKLAARKVKQARVAPLESPFTSYSHNYENLSKEQQQWYFYWRDQVRHGQYPATDLAYIFIHAPELVHLIGVNGPDDAYKQLRNLWLNYRSQHPKIEPHLLSWMLSLVTAYHCQVSSRDILLAPEAFNFAVSVAPDVLLAQYANGNLREIPIALLEKYVAYNIQRSSFFTSEQSLVQQVIPATIDIVNKYHINNGDGSLFAKQTTAPAVIELKRCWRADQTYLDWPTQLYFDDVPACSQNPNLRPYLTNIVKYAENKLREEKGFRGRLQVQRLNQEIQALVDRLISQNGNAINPPPTVPKIEIDLSQVERLRAESEAVLSMLQIEEEAIEDDQPTASKLPPELLAAQPVIETVTKRETVTDSQMIETEDEMWAEFARTLETYQTEVLAAIIDGTDPKAAIQTIATAQFIMPTMLIDGINELARDILGDILIESADEPRFVDDYYAPIVSQIMSQGRNQ